MSGELQRKKYTYNNSNCNHKIFTRRFLIEKFGKMGIKEVMYAGLPSQTPVLEEHLLSRYQTVRMFLAEINPMVYKNQKKFFKNKLKTYQSITHYMGNLLLAKIDFPLNFIWLDLCGIFTENLTEELYTFFQKNEIADEGLFAITFMASREQGSQIELYKQLQSHYLETDFVSLKDYKKNQLPVILEKMLFEVTGKRFTSEIAYPYKSSTMAYMQFNALSWKKQ